jgi:hypothetical protein
MNFEKAEDRENHHLLTMERKLDSMNAVNEAAGRLFRMWANNTIDRDKYVEVRAWIDGQRMGLAQWRNTHPKHRYPIDAVIEPQNLTAEQRRRLAAQRKEPGMGGQ